MENEIPNYTLKISEERLSDIRVGIIYIRIIEILLALTIIVGVSYKIYSISILKESLNALLFLIVMFLILTFFINTKKREPSPFEIQFYNNYLVIYREEFEYSIGLSRREFLKFLYKDISKFEYRAISRKITISGVVETTFYKYKKDGELCDKPSYHEINTGDTFQFYTMEELDINFITELESHTPLNIVFKDC